MYTRLIIDGNAVYEIDEECEHRKQKKTGERGQGGRDRCAWQEHENKKN